MYGLGLGGLGTVGSIISFNLGFSNKGLGVSMSLGLNHRHVPK